MDIKTYDVYGIHNATSGFCALGKVGQSASNGGMDQRFQGWALGYIYWLLVQGARGGTNWH